MRQAWLAPVVAVFLGGCATILPVSDVALYESLADEDVSMAAGIVQSGLERGREGERRAWHNPATGNGGGITVGRTFVDGNGAFCRDYVETIRLVDGRSADIDNTACRSEAGVWQWV